MRIFFSVRMLRSVPPLAVEESDVGNAGVGEQALADNENVITRAALRKQLVERFTVGAFVGVTDVVCRYQRQ